MANVGLLFSSSSSSDVTIEDEDEDEDEFGSRTRWGVEGASWRRVRYTESSVINLYSDTQTLPTPAMLEAMRTAELGDDVLRADPTVNRLEERCAELFGKEAALLVPSGTMANLVSLLAHGGSGDEVLLDGDAHVFCWEGGALCSVAGYTPRLYRSDHGRPDPVSVRQAIRTADDHFPRPRLLWLENSHCGAGGIVLPPDLQTDLVGIAREHGLRVHVDGARIFNSAVALGRPVAELVAEVDSVSFCLSKGLSCPIGSLVVGPGDFIHRARRARKRVGGGMRQAGIIAACGLVALDTMIERLAEDHANARAIAEGLHGVPGIEVDPRRVETNMVFADVSGWGVDAVAAMEALRAEGVLVSDMGGPVIRIVTHRMFPGDQVPAVVAAFQRVASRLA